MKRFSDDPVKKLANRLRTSLGEKHSLDITHCQALNLASASLGYRDWHDLRTRRLADTPSGQAVPVHSALTDRLDPLLLPLLAELRHPRSPRSPALPEASLPLLVWPPDGTLQLISPAEWRIRQRGGATLSPWPLLPPAAHPYARAPLLEATSFYWERGEALMADGLPITLDDANLRDDGDGTQLLEWYASLREATRGTSHSVHFFHGEDGSPKAVRLQRGVQRVPRKLKVPDTPLTVVYGKPVADRATLVLALAHALRRQRRVVIVDDPLLVGDAGQALSGACELLQVRPGAFLWDEVRRRLRPDGVLVLHASDPGDEAFDAIRLALTMKVRVIASTFALSWRDAESRLAAAGVSVEPTTYLYVNWRHAKERVGRDRDAWFADPAGARHQ
ncbi:glyoxalase superfamily protein [Deinococcus aestuarii]|uniref:glyoxalase superfamily protein n=1 Tax=Deinococcus aestuarii TaxID=2774531 RepID=UPI001C0B5527|nr:glyoxalase superfamily protein [Deinococcus aestuarii]